MLFNEKELLFNFADVPFLHRRLQAHPVAHPLPLTELLDAIPEVGQGRVDGDPLLLHLPCGASLLRPLRPRQVNKVDPGPRDLLHRKKAKKGRLSKMGSSGGCWRPMLVRCAPATH